MMFVQSQDERMLGYTGVRGIAWFDDTVSHRQITPDNTRYKYQTVTYSRWSKFHGGRKFSLWFVKNSTLHGHTKQAKAPAHHPSTRVSPGPESAVAPVDVRCFAKVGEHKLVMELLTQPANGCETGIDTCRRSKRF